MDVMKKFHASRSQEEAMVGYEYMFPCLSPQEIKRILCGAKVTFPADVYAVVEDMAKKSTSI